MAAADAPTLLHVYRVQDRQGRGPFRPGMSDRWSDKGGPEHLPGCFEEFGWGLVGELRAIIQRDGGACGCAVKRLEDINRWFTCSERARLAKLGYRIVRIEADRILRESEHQVVFWRRRPLHRDAVVVKAA